MGDQVVTSMPYPRVGDVFEHMVGHDLWTCTQVDYGQSPPLIHLRSADAERAVLGIDRLCARYRLSMPARYAVGMYVRGGTDGNAAAPGVEAFLGRPLEYVIDYGADQVISSTAYRCLDWDTNRRLVLGLWLAPNNGTANMATAAAGGYDGAYLVGAQDLEYWQSRIYAVRIGWECNATHYPWSVGGPGTAQSPSNYVLAFRRYAAMIRELCPGMAIEWNLQWDAANPEAWYPGDDVVDIVSSDIYPQRAFHSPYSWANVLARPSSLNWMDAFSAAHGKKMAIPEWGTDFWPSDFVPQMREWMEARASRIAYQSYWNPDPGEGAPVEWATNPGVKAQYFTAWGAAP